MNPSRLTENVCDVLAEQQIKLGRTDAAVSLYYPLSSLNRFFGADDDAAAMQARLSDWAGTLSDTLGVPAAAHAGDMFSLTFPPKAQTYIEAHASKNDFLRALVETVSRHGTTMEDVLAVFHRYAEHVAVEPKTDRDFDVLAYFPDGVPDAYRYCLTDEGCHIIYHRFTAEDYFDFYPEDR